MFIARLCFLTAAALATIAVAADPRPGAPASDIDALIGDLRDDEIDMNAERAIRILQDLPSPPIERLNDALDSPDWQQRQIAASLLWYFLEPPDWCHLDPAGQITPRLIEVTVEGLGDDALPYDNRRAKYTDVYNAADGFRRLIYHAHEARPQLEAGLESDDAQRRFICALILGFAGIEDAAPRAAPILIPHLRDNEIREDAKWAVHALHGFGPLVLPSLLRAQPDADEQQRELTKLLILDITNPPTSRAELEWRRELNHVSKIVFDPAIEMPTISWMGWLRDLPR